MYKIRFIELYQLCTCDTVNYGRHLIANMNDLLDLDILSFSTSKNLLMTKLHATLGWLKNRLSIFGDRFSQFVRFSEEMHHFFFFTNRTKLTRVPELLKLPLFNTVGHVLGRSENAQIIGIG